MARSKPEHTRPRFLLLARYTFHKNAKEVSPRDVGTIEHLLRRGRRQLEMYADSGVKDCAVSNEMRQWAEAQRQKDQNH
jgi:succinate dehydrogenase assembly factor 1